MNYYKDKIKKIALNLLEITSCPVVKRILLRDILNDPSYVYLTTESKQVRKLASEQWGNGSWGSFHSRSTKLKQNIPSTEVGVERALTLGLERNHPILCKTENYLVEILEGKSKFPDYPEKNDRWSTGVDLFVSSTLSLINPYHPALDKPRNLWLKILKRSFRTGTYDENDEIATHEVLTGASVKDSYLVLKSRYHLILMGSDSSLIPLTLKRQYIEWLWHHREGIGYLCIPLNRDASINHPGPLDRWFVSHELLSKYYPFVWAKLFFENAQWLWSKLNKDHLWDLGPKASTQHYFPLSDNWLIRMNRQVDWSTRILLLLKRFYDNSTL